MDRLRYILFIFVLHSTFPLAAQQYVLTNYSLEEGLPQSSIIAMYQDHSGNMWFGTQGGVSRYNGKEFKNYDSRHGLAGNHISAIAQDSQGRHWFGHRYRGITLEQHRHFTIIPLTEERINCIKEDPKGNVWVGTHGNGIYVLPANKEPRLENFMKLKVDEKPAGLKVFDFIFDDSIALVGTDNGMLLVAADDRFEESQITAYTPSGSGFPITSVFSFTVLGTDVWALGEEGLLKIAETPDGRYPGAWTLYPMEKNVDIYYLHNIVTDKEGTIWGVHGHGVFTFRNGKYDFNFYGTNYRDKVTNCIFSDRENNTWIGTMNFGALKYTDDKFRIHNEESGLLSNVVTSVITDKNGNLWTASEKGVTLYNGTDYQYITTANGLPHNGVQVLFEDSRGNIWMGFYDGNPLYRYDPVSKKFTTFSTADGMLTNSVLAIEEDDRGRIWFATLGYGVSRYTFEDDGVHGFFDTFTEADGLCGNSFWTIHKDLKGNLWFGSDNCGLSMFDGLRFHTYDHDDGLNNQSPAAIAHDSENNLWIASIGDGIYKFDGNTFINYSLEEGLSSDSPFSIMCDAHDRVWIGTNTGIDCFDPASETFKTYSREDGFLGIENNQNSIWKDEQGIIWFGTMNGVVRFDPAKDGLNTIPPVTLIEEINLFFNPFEYSELADSVNDKTGMPFSLSLKHNLNHLTFKCIGISHRSPKKIRYRYFLENFDTEWNPVTEETTITYTNLPPGNYTFQVMACNSDGIWNSEPVSLAVTIFPPYWQTWYFRLLAGVFILGSIYLVFWLRLKSIKSQKSKLERLVDEKTQELKHEAEERKAAQIRAEESDKLKTAFLANMSHEIRTPVNAIIGFSDLLQDPDISEEDHRIYLEYITGGGKSLMNLINDIIDISKIEAGEIRIAQEPCNLDNLLSEVFMTFHEMLKTRSKEGVELKLVKPDQHIVADILTDPLRLKQILSNLLNNAVKFTDSGSIVFGYKILDDNHLHFYVEDTGIGIPQDKQDVIFHRFRQVEDAYTRNYDGTGLGLTISRKLCRLIGGDMWVHSTEGVGSTFNFTIPFATDGEVQKRLPEVNPEELAEELKGKNILVVEDEDSNYILIENMLQDLSVNIIRADDGYKAVDVFRQNGRTIDLVLMDIKIPGMNGYDATRAIKKIKPRVPVVAQTAYAMAYEKQNCLDAGCDDYISKPYNKKELLSVIQKNIVACSAFY